MVKAYKGDDTFLLLAIYTGFKGVACMWLFTSSTLSTTWEDFTNTIRNEFGSVRDKVEIHFVMVSATKKGI